MEINLLFPVLNEHKRLENVQKDPSVRYLCTILDNGSTDDTPQIGAALAARHPGTVEYVRIEEKGVGIAFRTGVEKSHADIVGYMDIDLSTDIANLGKTIRLFQQNPSLDYVNGTRWPQVVPEDYVGGAGFSLKNNAPHESNRRHLRFYVYAERRREKAGSRGRR